MAKEWSRKEGGLEWAGGAIVVVQHATLERLANRTVEITTTGTFRWPRPQPSPLRLPHETKVLNKVHQCVLFTKAKRRCHSLTHTPHTHTPQTHTPTLTHSATHSHTHMYAAQGMHYLVRRKKSAVSYLCNHVAYSAWWHFSAAWVPLPVCVWVCVRVCRGVCAFEINYSSNNCAF